MALTNAQVDEAAAFLFRLRTARGKDAVPAGAIPSTCRPADLTDAYRVQRATRALLEAAGRGQRGWKIGCTTPVMQEYLEIPHPCAGTLYAGTLFDAAVTLRAADYFQLGLECELAVRLHADLVCTDGTCSQEQAHEAVGEAMASVEIVEHRFADFAAAGVASLVADDFFSVGCALGAPASNLDPNRLDECIGGFHVNGAPPSAQGRGAEILGHPLRALRWLAEHAARVGESLKAGQVVTLGSVVKTIYPQPGMRVEARFDGLAPVRIDVL